MNGLFTDKIALLRSEVTPRWRAEVKEIERKFFSEDFIKSHKLQDFLFSIVAMTEFNESLKQYHVEKRRELKRILKHNIKHLSALLNESSTLLDELPDNHTASFLLNTFGNQACIDRNWKFSTFFEDAKITLSVCNYLLNTMSIKEGRPKNRKRINIISMLISILSFDNRGRKLEPIIKNGSTGVYSGKAIDFILAVEPLLGKLGIELGTDGSLGTDSSIGEAIIKIMKKGV